MHVQFLRLNYEPGYAQDYYDVSDEKSSSKEMTLRDIFDIALTTLAFLSFGMFLLQVLMCITMVIFYDIDFVVS